MYMCVSMNYIKHLVNRKVYVIHLDLCIINDTSCT